MGMAADVLAFLVDYSVSSMNALDSPIPFQTSATVSWMVDGDDWFKLAEKGHSTHVKVVMLLPAINAISGFLHGCLPC